MTAISRIPARLPILAALLVLIVFSSCKDTRQLTYFERKLDTATVRNFTIPEPIIQKGDLLSIVVYSDNPAATSIYNQSIGGGGGGMEKGAGTSTSGYEVDQDGNILFQGIGPLNVEGLNKKQLTELLNSKLKDTLLKNPYYSIRFLNMKVSVLGEVKNPGALSIPNERLNILEALSLSGDFTDFAQRDSVLIIRENLGVRRVIHMDLSKTDVLHSPDYFLQHNDVVVVKGIRQKYQATDVIKQRSLTTAVSLVSIAIVLVNTVVILSR